MNSYLSPQNGADWATDFIERYGQPNSAQLIFPSENNKYWASAKVLLEFIFHDYFVHFNISWNLTWRIPNLALYLASFNRNNRL